MGRNKKPVMYHVLTGNKTTLSKEEIKRRQEAEEKLKIGEHVFVVTENILQNETALNKWKELVKIYEGFDFVTNVDVGVIEKYCLTHADYFELLEMKIRIKEEYPEPTLYLQALNELKLSNEINKKLDMLIKLEDRLFLNPLSRIKAVPPKPEEKKESLLDSLGFGNV